MTIIRAKNLEQVKEHVHTSGTLCTAEHAFQQGKPVFIGIPDGKPDDIAAVLEAATKNHEGMKKMEKYTR